MISLGSFALAEFLIKNNVDYRFLNDDISCFFTLEDQMSNVVNISVERNIIVIGKYQFLGGDISPIIEFTLHRQGYLLVPVSLYIKKKSIHSAFVENGRIRIASNKKHVELLFLLSKHLDKYKNSKFKMTDKVVLHPHIGLNVT